MMQTATQFAWKSLNRAPYEPPEPKRGPRFASSPKCWLCGGPTEGKGWPRKTALAPTFADPSFARAPDSDAVCEGCAAMATGETWQPYVTEKLPHIKTWGQASWRSYGHLFTLDHHECPFPKRWREILVEPPEPPFLAIVATSGQKNLIFRGLVAHSRSVFPVQFEEETIHVRHVDFLACLDAFEALTLAGMSKDRVLSGEAHQETIRQIGVGRWREMEAAVAPWRREEPQLMALAHFVARRAEKPPKGEDAAEPEPPPPEPVQFKEDLFA